MELLDFVGHRLSQAARFAYVVIEVVELGALVFEDFDELPVAHADGTGWIGSAVVAGEMPVDGVSLDLCRVLEDWEEFDSD